MVRYSAHGNHSRSGQQPVLRSDMAAYNASNYVGHSARRPKNHKRRNIIIVVVVAVILILGCSGVALAMSAKDAKADAEVLMDQGKTLVTQLKEGDKTGAGKTATELSATAKKLNDNVSSPLWAAATLIPVYGSDIAQVRTIASVADTLCAKAVTPLINALPAEGLSGIVVDGGVNVQAVEDMLTPLGAEYPRFTIAPSRSPRWAILTSTSSRSPSRPSRGWSARLIPFPSTQASSRICCPACSVPMANPPITS